MLSGVGTGGSARSPSAKSVSISPLAKLCAVTRVREGCGSFFSSLLVRIVFLHTLRACAMLRLTHSLSRRVFILVGAAPLLSSAHLWLPGDRLATLSERRWTSAIPSREAGSDPHVVLLPEMNQG